MPTGKTWLQLTNEVLRRLRENTVPAVTSTPYSTLIGSFVNEAKREVEDAWDWNRLRSTVIVTTIPAVYSYTLTDLSKRFRILDVFNVTGQSEMQQIGSHDMNSYFMLSTPQEGEPFYYNFNGQTLGDPDVDLWPIPNAVSTIKFNLIVPQEDMENDADMLTVPDWPVILGAWSKAISERGEDGGANYSEVDAQYQNAMADAITQDVGLARDEIIWQTQ